MGLGLFRHASLMQALGPTRTLIMPPTGGVLFISNRLEKWMTFIEG